MTRRPIAPVLFGASALALGLTQASAQDQEFADECVDLFAFVEDTDGMSLDGSPEILAVIERNDPRACQLRLTRLQREVQRTARPAVGLVPDRQERTVTRAREDLRQVQDAPQRQVETETEVVRERVELEEIVTVQGDVDVAVGVPTVEVAPEPAQVTVRGEPHRIRVQQQAPTIVVREQPARIVVGMPTITIEQDAPEIIVTMPPPDVDVASAEPTVEVRSPAPRVSVTVPEPRVDLNLQAVAGETTDEVRTRVRRQGAPAIARQGFTQTGDGESGDANVFVGQAEPNVTLTGLDADPEVTVTDAEPEVRFEGAEPNVQVEGEPQIRFERVGEPRVTVHTADAAPATDRTRPRQALAARGDAPSTRVRDIVGKEVRGRQGEEIGSIDRVVRIDGAVYAIVEHGGFLGLGDTDIPIPLDELEMRDDELFAMNLTEERAEQMQARDIERGQSLRRNDTLTIRQR